MANGEVITSFGNAGTRTARADVVAVGMGADDLLVYTVTVEGAAAAFGFGCSHAEEILSARSLDGGSPLDEYQWEYQPDDPDDVVVLLLSFFSAIKYNVRIDRISTAGVLLEHVRDVDYESDDPNDQFPDSLHAIRT